jgi:hypothetical protein
MVHQPAGKKGRSASAASDRGGSMGADSGGGGGTEASTESN